MSEKVETCETCRFWQGKSCFRYPPSVVLYPTDNQHPIAYWPTEWRVSTDANDWCGEHQPSITRAKEGDNG